MFKRLRTSLFACFCAVAVLGLIIFMLIAIPRVRNSALNQIEDELKDKLSLTSSDFSPLLEDRAVSKTIQDRALKIASISGDRVTVIRLDGSVIADSATPIQKLGELENHLDRPEIIEAAKSGIGRSVRYSITTGQELIYVALLLKGPSGKSVGFLRFSIPTTYATDAAMRINKSVLIALFASILFAILVSIILSKVFADPIVRLSEVAGKIARGQFPQHIIRRSRFEIGDLEKNVEEMSLKLSEMFNGLSAERTRVSAMLSSMVEGVFAVDRWGKVILANPAIEKTFGIIELDIIGKTAREAIRNNEIADMVEEARRELAGVAKEISMLVPIERSFIAEATPIKDVNGLFQGVVCVLHDITDIRKLEGYRSEFVANVSHELKTPLTAIKNYVETLLGGAIDDKGHNREFLQKIDKHASNLSALIDDILEISRLESKKEPPKFSQIDIAKMVSHAVDDISEKAGKKGIILEVECKGEAVAISGIEDHVRRAVMNLLDNAVNYTPSGGKISVSCIKEDGSMKVSVSDTGIGIAPEHLQRIFERFYRVDKGRSRDMGGTGLGLAIVKHVMNIHNGSVSVESREGVGSTFTLTFPVAAA